MDIVKKRSAHQKKYIHPTRQAPKQDPSATHIETFDEYLSRTRIKQKPQRFRKIRYGMIVLWCACLIFFLSITWAIYALYVKTNDTLAHISDNAERHSVISTISNIANPRSYEKIDGFQDGRINILLLGRANTHKAGKDLTDTIMMASINTHDYTVGLFSLPRDLLVKRHGSYVKINTLYQSGLRDDVKAQYIKEALTEITDQPIHYYVVMDFAGFIKIIDILDGINVDVPKHIKDERYPGPGYSYEVFEVYPGLQKFNGETALKYARTRHDTEGDFGRAKRQQQIMQAAKNKAFSLGIIVNPGKIAEIFDVLGDHLHTDISPNEIEPFIALTKKIDTHNISTVVVDAWQPNSLLISARQDSLSGLLPRIGNYKEIRERAHDIFDLTRIAQREKDIASENATIAIWNRSGDEYVARRLTVALRAIGFTTFTTHEPKLKKNEKVEQRDHTSVIDRTHGSKPFSMDELLKKIPATKDPESSIESDADFVIILGKDIVTTYTYTEISREDLERESLTTNDQ